MAFWNIIYNRAGPDLAERTTLATESRERRWSTGRGYCVEAQNPTEARDIARDHGFTIRGERLPEDRRVTVRERQRVPVLARGLARGMVLGLALAIGSGLAGAAEPAAAPGAYAAHPVHLDCGKRRSGSGSSGSGHHSRRGSR